MDLKVPSVDDLVELLRTWTTMIRSGTFPDALTPASFMKDLRDAKDRGLEEPELAKDDEQKLLMSMTRGWMLLTQSSETHYAGKDVEFGDTETAVFWYKPKDADTYKVIYGDLRIEDVAEEDLPTTQPADELEEAMAVD